MKILLKGYYGFGNFGDDILMVVAYKLLREKYPDASVIVFSNNTSNNKDSKSPTDYNLYVDELLGQEVKIIDWTHKGHFDLVINGGGGVFFDNSNGNILNRVINWVSLKLGAHQIFRIEKALRILTGKKTRITYNKRLGIGIGIGPFSKNGRNIPRIISEIDSFNSIIVRDKLGHSTLSRIGYQGKSILGSDLSLLNGYWLKKEWTKKEQDPNRISIVLRGQTPNLYNHYKGVAKQLQQNGYSVTFFSFHEYFDIDYRNYFDNEFPFYVWRPNENTIENFLMKLWENAICLTDRAHGAILSALGGSVPIIIRTSQKSDQIYELLDLHNNLRPLELKLEYSVDDIFQVLHEREQIVLNLTTTLNSEKLKLEKGLKEILQL